MNRVYKHFFIGNSSDARNESLLKQNNIKLVINFARDLSDPWYDGINYIKLGYVDGDSFLNKIVFNIAVGVLKSLKNTNYNILLHCHEGHNRSPFNLACAMWGLKQWKNGFDEIKKYRPKCLKKNWMDKLVNWYLIEEKR